MRPAVALLVVAAVAAGAHLARAAAQAWEAAAAPLFAPRPLTADGRFTKNAEGPEFTRGGRLFAVNCERDGTVCEIHPDGRVEVFVTLPEGSTANAIRESSSGDLLLADFTGHNVLRLDPRTKRVTVHAHDDRFNQPNDLAIRADDVLFASDPNWARGDGQLWRIEPDGRAVRLAEGLGTTNGLALSPDERVLYVAESVQRRVWAYEVDARGNLVAKRLVAQVPDHGLDGIKCDATGRLYVTRHGKGTVAVLSPDGALEREVPFDGRLVSNLVFGGPDGRSVFVTLQDTKAMHRFFADRPGSRWAPPPSAAPSRRP